MSYAALPTKNPGDVLTSTLWNTYLQGNADSGFMRMIADTTLGVAAATVSLASLPQTFAHLLVVAYLRGDTAATAVGSLLRFNGDTAANYDYETINAGAAAAAGDEGIAATSIVVNMDGGTAPANAFSPYFAIVPHYAGATGHKAVLMSDFLLAAASSGNAVPRYGGGRWRSTAAINALSFTAGAGNIAAGSRITVYGLPQ